jgi:hypothetical protein
MRTAIFCGWIPLLLGTAWLAAAAGAEPPLVLRGEKVCVEAQQQEGRLCERYLALRDGRWVEVARGDEGRTLGSVSVLAAGGRPLAGTLQKLTIAGGTLVEELAAGPHRIVRKLSILGGGPWLRVVTRLEPAAGAALHQLADRFRFTARPDWSFAPSVGGFNPDAQ